MDEGRDEVPDLHVQERKRDRRRNQTSSSESDGSKDSGYRSASPILHDLLNFQQPSLIEAQSYYFGLSGKPELLARTSHDKFVISYDGTFPRPKQLSNVGAHNIVEVYDSARQAIHELLATVKWSTLDIVRIGYSRTAGENPVVLLITVQAGTITALDASKIVHGCQKILQDKGCYIEVEMKAGMHTIPFNTSDEILLKDPYNRIPLIGQSIGVQTEGKQYAGTLGAYVKVNGGPLDGGIYGLTCDHVVFAKSEFVSATPPFFDHQSTRRYYVQQPATLDHDSLTTYMRNERQIMTFELENLLARQKAARDGTSKSLTQYQEDRITILQEAMSESLRREKLNNEFPREFGYVIVASGQSMNERHGNLRDWALINLDQDRFNIKPKNIAPDHDFSLGQLKAMNELLEPKDGFLVRKPAQEVTEIVTLDEVLSSEVIDTNGFHSFRVIKYGRTTGWTAGVVNEVRSELRRESGEISREMCIINVPSDREFTKKGDSGALVIDYHSRIVGLVHGGGYPIGCGTSFHYVTPVEWLVEDIKSVIGAAGIDFCG